MPTAFFGDADHTKVSRDTYMLSAF